VLQSCDAKAQAGGDLSLTVPVWYLVLADKANAINVYFRDIWPDAEMTLFVLRIRESRA